MMFMKMMLDDRHDVIKTQYKNERISLIDIVPVYIDELSIKRFQFSRQVTDKGVAIELKRGDKKITQTILQDNGIAAVSHNGKVILIFSSTVDLRHRFYEVLKAEVNMSRIDEDSQLGRELKKYMDENNITIEDLTLHYTPILLPNLLERKEYGNFLNEMKQILIMKYEPICNTRHINDVIDESLE